MPPLYPHPRRTKEAADDSDFGGFVATLFANSAAVGFTADLLFTSFIFWLAMIIRRRER
jgi:hypothetical protein